MTNSYKYGNGRLILGAAPLNITGQLTSCAIKVKENVKTTDAIPVLDDTEIPEETEADFSYSIAGKLFQDLAADGIVDYSWDHAGEWVEVVFVPDLPTDRAWSGLVSMVPIDVGGDITKPKTRPQSDFEWRFDGKPDHGSYDAIGDEVEEDV
jgi:hypothetical protein